MAASAGSSNRFATPTRTTARSSQNAAELAARHFDEVIQDDFFFDTTKTDSDIAAKGDKSWTQFRLELMDDAAENLIVKPAKAVNPKVKMVIKFPNWYEHFQGSGYDLEREPKIFDGIYTGTETRDPVMTDQHLQQYESYQIIRYFENIAPGRNGGGWVDTFSIRYFDRYAEQVSDTVFAKAREFTMFRMVGHDAPVPDRRPQRMGKSADEFQVVAKSRTAFPRRRGRASPAIRWNRRTSFSASSAIPSASPATSRFNPPARIFCTIISA